MLLSNLLPLLVVPALFLFLPFLGSGKFFTMAVSSDWRTSAPAKRIRYSYQAFVVAIAVLSALICAWAGTDNRVLAPVAAMEVFALLAAWAWGWNRTLPARSVQPVLRSASLDASSSTAFGISWILAALLPLLGAFALLTTHYGDIPQTFAGHFNSAGSPDHLVQRSPLSVFSPVLIGAIFVFLVAGLLVVVVHRGAGVADRGRYAAVARYIFIGSAWFVSLEFSTVALLPLSAHPQTLASGLLTFSSIALLLFAAASVGYMYRQRGVLATAQSATDDAHWKGGLWYYNRNDGALFVPKRIGFGYTLNMAHPESWVLMAATLAVIAVPLILRHL